RKLRMQSDVQQAARPSGLQLRNTGDRFGIEDAAADNSQASRALRDEHVAVRQPGDAPGMRQSFCHDGHPDTSAALGRGVRPRTVAELVGSSLRTLARLQSEGRVESSRQCESTNKKGK